MSWFRKGSRTTEHGYVEERLSAYLDGELSPKEQMTVDRHLATCQACQWNLYTLRQTLEWTRGLPIVPVPRAFTIPAPAQRFRAPQRRWTLVPLLQGATALVALLLLFVVAGDFLLRDLWLASAPAPEAAVIEAPSVARELQADEQSAEAVVVEATQVVEVQKEAEIPALPEVGMAAGTAGEESQAEPGAPPSPQEAASTEAPQVEQAEAEAPLVTPEGGGGEEVVLEAPAEEVREAPVGVRVTETFRTPTLVVSVTETYTLPTPPAFSKAARERQPTAAVPTVTIVAPTPTELPAPVAETPLVVEDTVTVAATLTEQIPTTAPTVAAVEPTATTLPPTAPLPAPTAMPPTAIAEASEAARTWAAEEDEGAFLALQESDTALLPAVEFALGILLILLATTTIGVMIWRRRAG